MPDRASLTYDGFEFREEATMRRYATLKSRARIESVLGMVALGPGLALLFLSYLEPSAYPEYLYLLFLAVSIPFSVQSFRDNSRLTEIVNTNEVRHVAF